MSEQDERLAFRLEPDRRALRPIVEQPDAADRRRRQDGAAAARRLALVVEADVAAHDREVERAAGFAHAFEAADELRHDLGPLGVAEVEAVGDRERPGADRAEVAVGFGDGLLSALIGVGVAVARGAVGGDRQRLLRAVDADHRGVAAGALDRVGADLAVILLPDPAARGEVGGGHQLEQVGGDVGAFGHVARAA